MESVHDLPLNPAKYNIFMFYDGYVESNSTSPVVMSLRNDNGMRVEFPDAPTPWEAWEVSFASLRAAYLAVVKYHKGFSLDSEAAILPPCCQKAVKSEARFCPECGESTRERNSRLFPEDPEDRKYMSVDVLSHLSSSTCDSYGWDPIEAAADRGWNIPGFIGDGILTVVHSYASDILMNYDEIKEVRWIWDKEIQFLSSDVISLHQINGLPNLRG